MDNIETNKDKFFLGIDKTCSMIEGCYGAAGGNVIVECDLAPYFKITNDGKVIMDAVKLSDPSERVGSSVMKEAGDIAEKLSREGRKTTAILTKAILSHAKNLKEHPMAIKRSLEECLPLVLESLDKQTKDVSVDDIGAVATISTENEKIGALLQEIYKDIGKDGIIEVDSSRTFDTYWTRKEGIKLRGCGYFAPYMPNDGNKAVYSKPKILIVRQKLSTVQDLNPLLEKLQQEGISELVIFCEDIELELAGFLALTHQKAIFKTLIIKSPKLWKDWLFEDFAAITGANIVSPATGITLKTVEIKDLGTCDKIITTLDDTTVLGIKDITEHTKVIEEEAKDNDQLYLRLSWLNTKAAVLKLGAQSETELYYLTKKTNDGVNASKLALDGGVVAGGGVALLNATKLLPDTIGGNILKIALEVPLRTIARNGGYDEITLNWLDFGGDMGYDAKNNRIVDMFESRIIDPAIVVKNAIKNAISIASTNLTANGIIYLPKSEDYKISVNSPNRMF